MDDFFLSYLSPEGKLRQEISGGTFSKAESKVWMWAVGPGKQIRVSTLPPTSWMSSGRYLGSGARETDSSLNSATNFLDELRQVS